MDDFQKLKVLTAYDFFKMDALVQDLTNALEESSRLKGKGKSKAHKPKHMDPDADIGVKKVKRKKKKAKVNTLRVLEAGHMSEASESSFDEALKEYCLDLLAQQPASDSDDILAVERLPGLVNLVSKTNPVYLAESDSLNENCSPMRPHRRKRRFKRMAVDSQAVPESSNLFLGGLAPVQCPSVNPSNISHADASEPDISPGPSTSSRYGGSILQEIKPGKRKRSIKDKYQGGSFDFDACTEDSVSVSGEGSQTMDVASNG